MLKKILKTIFFILLALLIGVIGFGYFNFVKDKYFNKNNNSVINNYNNTINIENNDSNKDNSNKNDDNKSNSNKKSNNNQNDVNKQYDTNTFDLSILLYEGENEGDTVRKVLERVIENANNNLYSNTSVTLKNVGTASYSYELDNKDDYINDLEIIRNSISETGKYNISFSYSKLKSHVDEIIIEQK